MAGAALSCLVLTPPVIVPPCQLGVVSPEPLEWGKVVH